MNCLEDFEQLLSRECSCITESKINLLRSIPAFGTVPLDQLKLLASVLPCRTFPHGVFIFRQGEHDSNGYIIQKGTVRMIRHYEHLSFIVKELGPSEFFGGLALFADIPRLFSAQAVVDTSCLIIERGVFRKFAVQFPEVALRVLEIMVKRIAAMEDRFIEMHARELKHGSLY